MRFLSLIAVATFLTGVSSQGGETDQCGCDGTYCQVKAVDVMVVFDETPSMLFDEPWLVYVLRQLDYELRTTRSVGTDPACPNRFSLVSFGRSADGCATPVLRDGSSEVFMSIDDLTAVMNRDMPSERRMCEDGYAAMATALRATRRSTTQQCVKALFIFMSDETRQLCGCGNTVTKKHLLRNYFKVSDIELAIIVDQQLNYGDQACLGLARNGTCYLPEDPSYHEFTRAHPGLVGDAWLTTYKRYSHIALKKPVRGSVWDINMVRGRYNWHTAHALRQQLYSRIHECRPVPTTPPPTVPPTTLPPTEPPVVACPAIQAPIDGSVTTSQENGRAVYLVSCDDGFSPSGGSATIECLADGTLSGTPPMCRDIDECQGNVCHARATCSNTAGSYTCSCRSGYTGDGTADCTDLNECLLNTANCGANTDCVNTDGAYTCDCRIGYRQISETSCTNIDECQGNVCHAQATCSDNSGSYTCSCRSGYTGDGAADCTDIDECSASSGTCGANSACSNTVGSYSCACQSGYRLISGSSCTNINECDENSSGCDNLTTVCEDMDGGFSCRCRGLGYTVQNNTHCSNVNECAASPRPCHTGAGCTDTDGSFTCQCRDGLIGDGINDCASVCVTATGETLRVGEQKVVHGIKTQDNTASDQSACFVFAITEGDGGGLPDGLGWIPSRNISLQLDNQAETANFRNNRFCLITDSGGGRTVNVGADSACGTAAELLAAVSGLRSSSYVPTLASAIDSQIRADTTCAGQAGYETIVIAMLPYDQPTNTLLANTMPTALLLRSAVLIVFGELASDHPFAEEYVTALDYNYVGYEPAPTGTDYSRHTDDAASLDNAVGTGIREFALASFRTGGIVFDSSWLSSPTNDYFYGIEAIFLDYVRSSLSSLRDSYCAACRCETRGSPQCGAERHVIVPNSCTTLPRA